MSNTIRLICTWCDKEFDKPVKEVNRQRRNGRDHFFCSRSCSCSYGNEITGRKRQKVTKVCPHCDTEFETLDGAKSKTFCSRSCASAGSVTPYRRERACEFGEENLEHGIETVAQMMRKREAWKYTEVKALLETVGLKFQFEHITGEYIFDLALLDKDILIEFDGEDHRAQPQKELDQAKDAEAKKAGWEVERITVQPHQIIHPRVLYPFIKT